MVKTISKKSKNNEAKMSKSVVKEMSKSWIIETRFKEWQVLQYAKISIKNPILIEGMPGIGNVGKICMDLLIEDLKAELLMTFFSHNLPNSVFVNEDNLVSLPRISLYHKKISGQDFLFLTGDVQPITENSSYEFSELIVELFINNSGKYIVTLGGIGLPEIPDTPRVFLTGNDKKFVEGMSSLMEKKKLRHDTKIYGMVGPILGVSGLLLGVSKNYDLKAFSLLAETFGHPVYVGLKGSKAILQILNGLFKLGFNFDKLDKEIKQIDAQMAGIGDSDLSEGTKDKVVKYRKYSDVNYIG